MQGETQERWRELCEMAVVEQDPVRFTAIITELNRVLAEKKRRLDPPPESQYSAA